MKKVVVSIHDVTSHYRKELEVIFKALDDVGVFSRSELVVPDFDKRLDITEDAGFIDFINSEKKKGAEISLHGIHHYYAEFYRYDYDGAKAALSDGLKLFKEAFGFSPPGFVAPQWLQSHGSLKAVWEADFMYTETLCQTIYKNGSCYRTFPFNYDWGVVWIDKLITAVNASRCRMRKSGLVRFALHPMDVTNKVFDRAMDQLKFLQDNEWETLTYEQLGTENQIEER